MTVTDEKSLRDTAFRISFRVWPVRQSVRAVGRIRNRIFPLRDDAKMKTRIPLSQADEQARLRRERLNLSIAEMGLSVRTTNCLEETGILTVRDLLNATPKRLLSISNFGEKTLDEVYASLEKLGFYRPGREAVSN
jgi:DNA-directed RNA polymerase subunit alpha